MEEKKDSDFSEQSLSSDREVITIGVGSCGNRMNTGFWRNILDEHCVDLDGALMEADDYKVDNTRIGTYFREHKENQQRYIPRTIIVDSDVTTIDNIMASNMGTLFDLDSYLSSGNSANNLFPLGFHNEIMDGILEQIRIEAEKCSSVQGFQIMHSVGGGTGSGLTAHLSQLLKDDYFDRLISSYTVYPCNLATDIVIEPYNMVLSMPSLLQHHDMNSCIDNETLFDISSRLFHNDRPSFVELNQCICNVISSSTAGLRFKGSMNMDMRKMAVNLIPFPRLKFLSITDAPMMYQHARTYTKITIESLINRLFHQHEFLCHHDISPESNHHGRFLAASVIFRGCQVNEYLHDYRANECEMEYGIKYACDELAEECFPAIRQFVHSTLVYQGSQTFPLTGTLYANHTGIRRLFERNLERFQKLYKRKAFMQYYQNEGVTHVDFNDAVSDIRDLLEEYDDKDSIVPAEAVPNEFQLDTGNRRKLQRNGEFFSKFNKSNKRSRKKTKKKKATAVRKNKKVYVKPNKKSDQHQRVVIVPHKRRQALEKAKKKQGGFKAAKVSKSKKASKKKVNAAKKKKRSKVVESAKRKKNSRKMKPVKKRRRNRKRKDSSDDSNDFEEESSSESESESDSDDKNSSSTSSDDSSTDNENDTSSYGLGTKSSNQTSTENEAKSSDSNESDSEQTDTDSD